jgi:hypothetical protein
MFAVLHLDINSPKSSLLHLTGQPYWKKSRSAEVKDRITNLFLRNNLIDRYKHYGKVNTRKNLSNEIIIVIKHFFCLSFHSCPLKAFAWHNNVVFH